MLGIEEGTNEEVLEKYIGHMENSVKEYGNVCLVAHNRDYKNNYFEKLYTLEEGDLIYYKINEKTRVYKVYETLVIYETDTSEFEQTDDNRITLVTEINNRDNYRLCVQALEYED